MSSYKAETYCDFPGPLSSDERELVIDGARLSMFAYTDPGILTNDDQALCTGTPEFVSNEECDAQAYLVEYIDKTNPKGKPILAIVVRGTSSIMDWICDMSTYQTVFGNYSKTNHSMVHSGFYRQFLGLMPKFNQKVEQHLKEGGKLMCVGHSLGAAVACIASVHYGMMYQGQVMWLGYGGPRCGNASFVQEVKKYVYFHVRCKNAKDPVPACIPPLYYSHVGEEMHVGPPDGLPDVPVLFDASDHSISAYVKGLESPTEAVDSTPFETTSWLVKLLNNFTD